MNESFEGHLPAKQDAELKSRKKEVDFYVVKVNAGKLFYVVTENINSIPHPHKVLDHYKNGQRIIK